MYFLRFMKHTTAVVVCVEKGTDIHADSEYALRGSARNGHHEIVKFLIKKALIFLTQKKLLRNVYLK